MMYAQSKNKIKIDRIQLYCVLYLVTWLLAPPLAYGTIYRLLAVVAAVLWFGLQFFRQSETKAEPKAARRLTTYVFCMVIYVVSLLLLECFIERHSLFSVIWNSITTYILLFVGYIGGVYAAERRENDLKIIFYAALIIAVVFSITTIFRSDEFYEYTRLAGGEDEAFASTARRAAARGVGAFGFFCFTSVFAPLVLWIYMKKRTWWYFAAFAIIEIGVISAGYTLALIISLVGIFYCFMVNARSGLSKAIIIVVAVFLIFSWQVIADELYSFLYRITEGSFYHNKVIDIFRFILEGESADTVNARAERYLFSLKAMFEYPLFGALLLNGRRASGYHSSILDTYSIFGWIIGTIWLYLITLFPPATIGRSCENSGKLRFMAGALLFFTALFNQYVMMMGVFYLVYPALPVILCKLTIEENQNDENTVGDICSTGASGEDNRKRILTKRDLDRRNRRRFIRK